MAPFGRSTGHETVRCACYAGWEGASFGKSAISRSGRMNAIEAVRLSGGRESREADSSAHDLDGGREADDHLWNPLIGLDRPGHADVLRWVQVPPAA